MIKNEDLFSIFVRAPVFRGNLKLQSIIMVKSRFILVQKKVIHRVLMYL